MRCDNTDCLKVIRFGEVWGTSMRVYCSPRCRNIVENPKPVSGRIVGCVVAVIAAFMLTFALSHKAHAHNPLTHAADSLSDATSDAYGVCCSGDDYHIIQEWETTATGYRIKFKGEWIEAKRTVKVSNMTNPDGEAKAWIYYSEQRPYIRCFMEGALG